MFVDVWASWCHACLSLKEVVLRDPKLRRLGGSFVWLSIDSELAKNEPFLERFPTRSLPTLWVIDPATETPRLKWLGTATADELVVVLGDARTDPGSDARAEATALLVQGDRESAAGKSDEAVALYRQALAIGGEGWDRRARALETLSMRLSELNRAADAVVLARDEAPKMPPGTSRVNVIRSALNAASALPPGSSALAAVPDLLELGRRVARDPAEPILVDDRSTLFQALVGMTADRDAAQDLAREWSDLLERAARAATDPATRRVWDSHRMEAFLVLGEPERAVPMLEQSEREDPTSYNPPARLARVNLALGKLDVASADVERALSRSEGPRKLRIYMLKADIRLAAKDRAGARAALEAALAFAREARLPPRFDRLTQAIEKRARSLGAR